MDDMEHSNTMADDVAETSFKKRPRKKNLYNQILQQMEFYFSDANLTRDRFLSQLLAENKNVPLEVFLRFNKIRAMTGSTEEIAKALGSSQLLKITEDGKCVYRTSAIRKKENQDDCIIYVEQLPPDANHEWVIGIFSAYGKVEYVSIPKYKNRAVIKGFAFVEFDTPEAAKKALEAFGSAGCCLPSQMPPEELCSIATFKTDDTDEASENKDNTETCVSDKQTKKHKKKNKHSSEEVEETGVNFDHEIELPESEEPKSKKLKTEVDEQYTEDKSKKKKKKDVIDADGNQQEPLDDVLESETTESHRTKKGKKRKLDSENSENVVESKYCNQEAVSNNAPIKKKKKKSLVEEEVRGDEREDSQIEGTVESETPAILKKKNKHQQIDDTESTKNDTEEMEDNFDVSRNLQQTKKRKKKQHEAENEDDGDKEVEDAEDEGTSKRSKKQVDGEDVGENDDDNDETGAVSEKSDKKKRARKKNKNKKKKNVDKKEIDPTSLGLRIISKNEWRRLRNKYLNLQREKMQALKNHLARAKFGSNYQSPYPAKENGRQVVKKELKPEKTKYMPGVIIHIDLAESLGDVKAFKTNAKSHPGVTYVDAIEGDSEVHIRCSSAEVAQKLLGEQPWDNMLILEGEAEKKYWEKIMEHREHKIKNKVRVNVRGRDKLLKRAERELGKHIKFDD